MSLCASDARAPSLARAALALALLGAVVAAPGFGTVTPPGAFFCEYQCGTSADAGAAATRPPSRPGTCMKPEYIYRTRNEGWLLLKTRNPDWRLPFNFYWGWTEMCKKDMTWEGWFRFNALPESETMLVGTHGSNHDTNTHNNVHRRRYGAVLVGTDGALQLRTNMYRSTGFVSGPSFINAADGGWHHVAAVFRNDRGAIMHVLLRVENFNYNRYWEAAKDITGIQTMFARYIAEGIGRSAELDPDGIYVTAWEGQDFYGAIEKRFIIVSAELNTPPERVDIANDLLLKMMPDSVNKSFYDFERDVHVQFPGAYGKCIMMAETCLIEGPPGRWELTLNVTHEAMPTVTSAGSAELWVDGQRGTGSLTYRIGDIQPREDNMGMDGQFQIGGGMLGRTLDVDVSRFHLWSRGLERSDLEAVSGCVMPSLHARFGGVFPYGLQGDYALSGSGENAIKDVFDLAGATLPEMFPVGGDFAIGGLCGPHGSCMPKSPEACPLARSVQFPTFERCQAFAEYNFCTTVGQGRNLPSQRSRQGCHAGAAGLGLASPLTVNRQDGYDALGVANRIGII